MTADKKPTPAEFVRTMSMGKPEEIAAAAEKVGITITPTYVSKVRALDKARAAKAGGASARKPAKRAKRASKATQTTGGPASTGTPSDFVRSMPNASPAEIMAAAKAQGMSFSRGLIYMVRTKTKTQSKTRKPGHPSSSAKTSSPVVASRKLGRPVGSGKPNKSDFIRSMPDATAAEVVAAAKANGFSFDSRYVSTIRSNARAAAKRRAGSAKHITTPAPAKRGPGRPKKIVAAQPSAVTAAVKRGPGRPPRAVTPAASGGSHERTLRAAVSTYILEYGIASARSVVEDVAAKLRTAAGAQ